MRNRTLRFALASAALAGVGDPATSKEIGVRDWTITDIVEAPSILDVALSHDGKEVAYLLRRGSLSENREIFEFHVVSLANGRDRMVATSSWLGTLRLIPSQDAWSVLGDFGEGVQLYRFDRSGARTTIASQPDPVLVGSADGAVSGMPDNAPVRFGVTYYRWRPDGRALFYSVLERKEANSKPLFDSAVVEISSRRRWEPDVNVQFYVRESDHTPVAIHSRPGSDIIARLLGGDADWQGETLYFSTTDDQERASRVTRWRWTASRGVERPVAGENTPSDALVGPYGGALSVRGYGTDRRIIETSVDGGEHDYGPFVGALSDPRSPGIWRSPEGDRVLVSVRLLDSPRYSILLLTKGGRRRLYVVDGSLTRCSFDPELRTGACIQQGLALPPRLVSIDLDTGRIRPIADLAPRYDALRRLRFEPRSWRNAMGYVSTGFIVWPSNYAPKKRYPLVVITHGSDADEQFVSGGLQWNYPLQLLAQRGYIVALVNDPSPHQSATLTQAASAWSNCGKGMPPTQVQDLEWLNGVTTYEALVGNLVDAGAVDPTRVGIAGYSRGSQMANVAMTNSQIFRAASSGDGGYLEPAAWRFNRCTYRGVFGGGPGEASTATLYRRLAPSYRADKASGAILQQMAEPRAGAVDFYQSLRDAGVPAQITLYPGESDASDETHFFHIPANRMTAMRENLCWFDFWLRGISGSRDECPRIGDWEEMALDWRDRKPSE
jgi:dipeptidyl aminopeptidase/acylaminoacyl peptidase